MNGEKEIFRPVRIHTILDHGIQLSRRRFSEGEIQLIINYPDEEVYCLGQETQLSQVMMNLLSNAYDAASDGPSPKWVKISFEKKEKQVEIIIQDSGIGISAENKLKIMEPFFTTKPLNKGTGLGLSISKSIIDQHEGILALDESQIPTTFIIRLKAAP